MTTLLVNRNGSGVDVIHAARFESCNLDDADDVVNVEFDVAEAMEKVGTGRFCEHCFPTRTVGAVTERQTLDVQNHLGDDR